MFRVYKYGCQPFEGSGVVVAQMDLANKYRNKLAELEIKHREKVQAYLAEHCPLYLDAKTALDEASAAIEKHYETQRVENQKSRKKLAVTEENKASLAELKSVRRDLASSFKVVKKSTYDTPEVREALGTIGEGSKALKRQARAECGLYWGTYLLVEDAASSFYKGAPPKFTAWRGDGRIGVQLIHGLAWEKIVNGGDSRIRLTPYDNGRSREEPGEKTKAKRWLLWIRIGSTGKRREPVWAKIPIILDRQPPIDTLVKWVVVNRRVVAGTPRWNALFTLDMSTSEARPTGDGAVGIDIGYRLLSSGKQRIAVAHGGDGETHELNLPAEWQESFDRIERIQSHRDEAFNAMRDKLVTWLNDVQHPWMLEKFAYLAQWRSRQRLARLVLEWSHRSDIPGDQAIIKELLAWRKQEMHLFQYQEHGRRQTLERRTDCYRVWVAGLRRKYGTAYIERMNLREAIHDTNRRPEDRETITPQRRLANRAALSTLVGILKYSGLAIVLVPPEDTTTTCHACGGHCDGDMAARLWQTCEHCGERWDQDENAARNLLSRGEAATKGRESLAAIDGQGVATDDGQEEVLSRYERRTAARKRLLAAKRAKEL